MLPRAFLAVAFSLFVAAAEAASDSPRDAEIDALFAAWNKPNVPGVAVAIVHHGRIVYDRGYGCANLEYDIPIRPQTVFHVASVSKQFTAMAILLLEQDGKLTLDDDARRHLPELPDYGHTITLRHLLQHTSGIRDQWNTLALAGWDLKDVITQDQILRLLFRQRDLNFPPGERMLYSNGGFTLLAEIVRRVSGKPFPEFCQERIFSPLAMSHTHFHLRLEEIVPNRAYSYASAAGGYTIAPLNYANVGATSLFTTAGDLARWLDNFRAPKVGNAAVLARMTEPGTLSSGRKSDYALGIGTGRHRGLRTVSHGGADAGYRSYVVWYPAQEFGVALASNHGAFNGTGLANRIADLFLAAEFTEKAPAAARKAHVAVEIEPASFDKFVGSFAFDEAPEFILTYTREGNRYYAQATGQDRFEIFPESPTKFFYKVVNAQVSFVAGEDGTVNRIVHHQNGRDQRGTRVAATAPVPETKLERYVGAYWSEELETRYTFFLKDGRLFGRHMHHGEFPLTRIAGNRFRTSLWFMPVVEFVPNADGEVLSAKIGGGRVTGIHFERQKSADPRMTSTSTAPRPGS